jgi:ubiquitin C-terminal hydrolase
MDIELISKYENKGLSGLKNLGNTCFMNSGIQCLSHTIELTDYFLSKKFVDYLNKDHKKAEISITWYKLINALWETKCIVSPNSFHGILRKYAPELGNFGQNDVQEFIIFIVDSLHEIHAKKVKITIDGKIVNEIDRLAYDSMKVWKSYFKDSYSKIIELFYGQIVSTFRNMNGKVLSRNYDPLCFFSLEIPRTINNVNIYDCFNLFTKPEILDGDNQYRCEDTEQLIDAQKDIKFWSFPKILIISFKRFNAMGFKVGDFINFPTENLDLSRYCVGYDKKKYVYDLYAICNHTGGLNGGHYYSYCKNLNGKWHCFNDKSVTEIDKNIVSKDAYVLFYRQK